MARIDGYMYKSDGTVNSLKSGYILWELTAVSIENNTRTINVKLYIGNQGGTTLTAATNQAFWIKYNNANTYSGTKSWSNTAVGTDILVGETNYTIEHSNNGSAKEVLLTGNANVAPGTFYDHIAVSGTITLPKISNGNIKISGTWKSAFSWIKILGTWKRSVMWRKISGTWKKGV